MSDTKDWKDVPSVFVFFYFDPLGGDGRREKAFDRDEG